MENITVLLAAAEEGLATAKQAIDKLEPLGALEGRAKALAQNREQLSQRLCDAKQTLAKMLVQLLYLAKIPDCDVPHDFIQISSWSWVRLMSERGRPERKHGVKNPEQLPSVLGDARFKVFCENALQGITKKLPGVFEDSDKEVKSLVSLSKQTTEIIEQITTKA